MKIMKKSIILGLGAMLSLVFSVNVMAAETAPVSQYKETFTPASSSDAVLTVEVTGQAEDDGYLYISKTVTDMAPAGQAEGANVEAEVEECTRGKLEFFRVKAKDPAQPVEVKVDFNCPGFYAAEPEAEDNGAAYVPVSTKFTNYLSFPVESYSVTVTLPEGMEIVKVSTPSKYADFLLGETEDGCRTINVSKKNVAPAASVSSAFTIQPSENNVKNIVLWVACLAVGGAVLVAKLKENK